MNSTTFTIESVHGVKQTFVLGPTIQVADNKPQESKSGSESSKTPAKNGS